MKEILPFGTICLNRTQSHDTSQTQRDKYCPVCQRNLTPPTHPPPHPSPRGPPLTVYSCRSALTPTLLRRGKDCVKDLLKLNFPWFPKSLSSRSLLRTANWAASQNLGVGNTDIFKNSSPTKTLAVSLFEVKRTLFPGFPETLSGAEPAWAQSFCFLLFLWVNWKFVGWVFW